MNERPPAHKIVATYQSDRGVLRIAAGLGVATVLVKLLALAKDWLVARSFGAGDELDAFLVAFLLPSYAVAVVAHSFGPAFLPSYIRVRQQSDRDVAAQMASAAVVAALGVLLMVTLAMVLSAPWVLPLVGWGFDTTKLALAERLLNLVAIVLLASGLSAVLTAVLNAEGRFVATALAPLAIPAGTIVVFIAGQARWGIEALAVGTSAGFMMEALLLFGWTVACRLLAWPRGGAFNAHLAHVGRQYTPMVAGSMLMSSSLVVDQAMAASLGSGNVSVFNYAGKLVALALGIVAASLSTALFPRFSQLIAERQWDELRSVVRRFSRGIVLLSLPVVAGMALLSEPLVRVVFERGAFTPEVTAAVSEVQLWLLPQIPFYVLAMIGSRLLSALDGNRLVLCIAALNLAMNVGGNLLLMHWFGVRGIAMSTSLMYAVAAMATFAAIRLRLQAVGATGTVG